MSDDSGEEHRPGDDYVVGDGDGDWDDHARSHRANDDEEEDMGRQQQPLPDSPFVPITKLRDADWAKRQNSYQLSRCAEFELGPECSLDELAAAADASHNTTATAAVRHLLGLSAADNSSFYQIYLFWITPYVFLARGMAANNIDRESQDRFTVIFRLETKYDTSGSTTAAAAAAAPTSYSIGCRTRLPDNDDDADRSGLVAAVDLLVRLVANQPWVHMTLSTRRTLRPLSASTAALQQLVGAPHPRCSGPPRVVEFDYHGLSNDQWRAVFQSFHGATRLAVTDSTFDDDNNCFPCLLEALQNGLAPKRISVDAGSRVAASRIPELAAALRESRTVSELSITDKNPREHSRNACRLLVSAAADIGSLKALEVNYAPKSRTEWESIWSVAASHPMLSTLRVQSRPHILARDRSSGYDLLQAVEAAVRSNRRLAVVEIADAGQKYHETKEYKDRILPLLRSNRVAALTSEIKRGTEEPAGWGGRLFAVAVHRLCQSNNSEDVAALSCLLNLFRGNPERLERCTRVPDVLRRLWTSRMGAVDSLLHEVLQIERRMAAAGVEIPSAMLLPNLAVWMGTDERTQDANRSAVEFGAGETASRPKRPKTN